MVAKHKWTWAVAVMLAALTVPATALAQAEAAQPAEDEGTDSAADASADPARPLAGMSEDAIITFFTLISATPELEELVSPMIVTMLEPGEAVPGWRESGVDILAEISARSGGLAGNLLRDDDTEVLSVTDLSGTNAPDLSGYTRLRLRAAPPGGANEQNFASFAPGVWMGLEMQHTRRGNALCYKGLNGVTLYSKEPLTAWDEETVLLTATLIAAFDRVAAREVCVTYQRDGDAYRLRSFLPDGRSLPQMDDQSSVMRIMPAAELSSFMRNQVPVLAPE